MSKTSSLRYFGRAVPVLLRSFPTLQAERLVPLKGTSGPQPSARPIFKFFTLPSLACWSRWGRQDPRSTPERRSSTGSTKQLKVPIELSGSTNMLVIGFRKKDMIREMFTWYSLGKTLYVELLKKKMSIAEREWKLDALPFHCYTVFILPRAYRWFHWWLRWRYKRLIRLYVVNKLKKQEETRLRWLATEAGLRSPDPTAPFSRQYQLASERLALLAAKELADQDDVWSLPDQELKARLTQQRQEKALVQYQQARADVRFCAQFADALYAHTLICYTSRRKFLDDLQLPDWKRTYVGVVNTESKILWFEDEKCTIAKANDALSAYRLEHMKVPLELLPPGKSPSTTLYLRCASQVLSVAPRKATPEPLPLAENATAVKAGSPTLEQLGTNEVFATPPN